MHCGGCGLLIDFSQVPPGSVVACPRCGEQYRTPEPTAPPVEELPRTNMASGVKRQSQSTPAIVAIISACFVAVLVVAAASTSQTKDSKPAKPRQVVESSAWDGSVRQVVKYLKSNLRDPDSYESIEWSPVIETDTGFMVRHKYRAKNGFGGYVVSDQIFLLDAKGLVVGAIDRE